MHTVGHGKSHGTAGGPAAQPEHVTMVRWRRGSSVLSKQRARLPYSVQKLRLQGVEPEAVLELAAEVSEDENNRDGSENENDGMRSATLRYGSA